MINLRKPQINAPTLPAQVQEIKSYLIRLVNDLQYQIEQDEREIDELKKELERTKKTLKEFTNNQGGNNG